MTRQNQCKLWTAQDLYSGQVATGLMHITKREYKKKSSGGRRIARTEKCPDAGWKTDRFHDQRILQDNDVQVDSTCMTDLLNVESTTNSRKFDHCLEGPLMALDEGPEVDFFGRTID